MRQPLILLLFLLIWCRGSFCTTTAPATAPASPLEAKIVASRTATGYKVEMQLTNVSDAAVAVCPRVMATCYRVTDQSAAGMRFDPTFWKSDPLRGEDLQKSVIQLESNKSVTFDMEFIAKMLKAGSKIDVTASYNASRHSYGDSLKLWFGSVHAPPITLSVATDGSLKITPTKKLKP